MSKAYKISEPFEHKGYFGLPHSKSMIAGILNYTPSEGVKLELIGSIKDNMQEVFSKDEIDCIWGELDNGLFVTLFHCFSSFSMNTACSFVLEQLQACSTICIKDGDRDIYAFYRPDIDESIQPKKFVYDFLFSYADIYDSYPTIISNWMNNSKSRPIISHLIDSITFSRVFTENDFLIVVQALDGFNRRFLHMGGHFNKVLNDMFKKFKHLTLFKSVVFDGDSIANTRNYFAHMADESSIKDNVVRDGKNLYDMTQTIRKLLICYLMELVGFSINDIEKITKESTNHFII